MVLAANKMCLHVVERVSTLVSVLFFKKGTYLNKHDKLVDKYILPV